MRTSLLESPRDATHVDKAGRRLARVGSGAISALHHKLQEVGVPSVYIEFRRTDHAFDMFLPAFSPSAQAAMYEVDRFLAMMASPHDWQTSSWRAHPASIRPMQASTGGR